ncbi:MAG TPA: VOC family protein [Acidisphaera sp.]|nr:VOC family protein [Acidisphaera sp.]
MSDIPRISGVLETSLYVAHLDLAQRFYQDVFGFETFLRDRRMCAMGVVPNQVLLLFLRGGSTHPSPAPGGLVPPHDAHGNQHLCFAIPRNEVEPWARHLAAHGIAVESHITWPNTGISLYFRDPDGHSLEVACPGLWPNY